MLAVNSNIFEDYLLRILKEVRYLRGLAVHQQKACSGIASRTNKWPWHHRAVPVKESQENAWTSIEVLHGHICLAPLAGNKCSHINVFSSSRQTKLNASLLNETNWTECFARWSFRSSDRKEIWKYFYGAERNCRASLNKRVFAWKKGPYHYSAYFAVEWTIQLSCTFYSTWNLRLATVVVFYTRGWHQLELIRIISD